MQAFGVILGLFALALTVLGSSCPQARVSVLHKFPYPSWAENLAVRANGKILVTRLDTPSVWLVDPVTGNAVLVYAWDATLYSGCLGIAETTSDVFYVVAAAFFNSQFAKTSGVNSVFMIDMNTFAVASRNGVDTVVANATVAKAADVDDAQLLNGMAALDARHVLVADVSGGVVFKVDTVVGTYSVAVDDPKMRSSYVPSPPTTLGVNGIKIFQSHLYWTNTAAGFVARVPIDVFVFATSPSAIAVTNVPLADDFIIRSDGVAFVCQNQQDKLSIAYLDHNATVEAHPIAGSNTSTILAGVSAAAFGRLHHKRLFLTTSGGEYSQMHDTRSFPIFFICMH